MTVASPPVPAGVRTLVARWHRVECWVASLAFALIAGLLIVDVVGRELLAPLLRGLGVSIGATSIPGGQKIAVYAMVIGSFCGIGIATATNTHLVPRVAFGWVPKGWSDTVARLGDLFTAAFMFAVAWYGVQFVLSSKETGMRAPVLGWEVWPFQFAIPAGFASAAVRYLVFAGFPGLKPPPPEFQE
jgi:TRAP-type C4-dicarboxylate transport system permease small subunit